MCHVRWALALTLLLAMLAPARAAGPPGTNSRQARDESVRTLPLNQLTPANRERVLKIINDTSIFRRMPAQAIDCDPQFYAFLVEHPEVVVNIWSVLGLSEVKLKRLGPDAFDANDGAGTVGRVEFIYRSHDMHLLYGEGVYEGRLFSKPVRGRSLMVLRTSMPQPVRGKHFLNCQLDAFMQLDNVGVDILAKTFQPLVGPVADHNFRETTGFVESLNRAAEINYPGVQSLTKKLTLVEQPVRDEFLDIAERVAIQAALAETENADAILARRPASSSRPKPRPESDAR